MTDTAGSVILYGTEMAREAIRKGVQLVGKV